MAAISNVEHSDLFIMCSNSLGLELENSRLNGNFKWILRKLCIII